MNSLSPDISEPLNFLLLAALSKNKEAVDFYLSWRERIDFENISFAEYELLTKVYENLRRFKFTDELTPKIKGISRRTWLENRIYINELADFFGVLNSYQNDFILRNREPLASGLETQKANSFALRDFQILTSHPLTTDIIKDLEEKKWKVAKETLPGKRKSEVRFKNGSHLSLVVKFDSSVKDVWQNYEAIEFSGRRLKVLNPTDYLFFVFETEYLWDKRRSNGAWVILSALVMENAQIDWSKLAQKSYHRKLNYALAEMLDGVMTFAPSEDYSKYRYKLFEAPPNKLRRIFSAYQSLRESYRITGGEFSIIGFASFLQQLWKADSIFKLPLQIAKRLLKS